MVEQDQSQRNTSQTGDYTCVFVSGTRQEQAVNSKEKTSANGEHPDTWKFVPLKDRLMLYFTFGIFLAAAATYAVFQHQANIMQDQLGEMQSAGQQAERLAMLTQGQMVNAAKEADNTKEMADALTRQAGITNRQLNLAIGAQIPFVFLKEIQQTTEDLHTTDLRTGQVVIDSIVKWPQVWHNSGGSKPVGLKIWDDCTDFMNTKPMEFHRRIVPPTEVVLGPGADRTINGCEASYAWLKATDDENLARAQTNNDARKLVYVFGGADYKDFLGHPHTVEYCYQVFWDNRSIKFGFELIQCQAPDDGHNCTDEECKDWNPRAVK